MKVADKTVQRGFTLVELAVVLVVIGIILGAVLKGQELVNNAKGKRLQNDLKALESMMWTYYDRKGRWPGDCNADGLIQYPPANALAPVVTMSDDADPTKDGCGDNGSGAETGNAPFSDMRASGVAPTETPNVSLARHVANGPFQIGMADDSAGSGAQANVIVAYNVPTWMAKMIDAYIDGNEAGQAGRIRRWDVSVTGGPWPSEGENDKPVALAYFFDRPMP